MGAIHQAVLGSYGGLSLDLTEDFSTDATGKFTNLSTGTAAWNSGTTSLRVGTGASANPIIRWDNSWPLFAIGQSLEMDFKIISEGSGGVGLRHAGIFLTTGSSFTGYRFVSINGNLAFSSFSGGSETAIATYTGAASAVIVGSDNTIKMVRVAANTFSLYLNGTLVAAGVAGGSAFTDLRACMFGYINTVDFGRMRQWG
jgi:hypothetical protein